ncbi:SUKH-3 domain-containing protein [Streptomyces sp. NPDC002640]
MDAWLTEAGWHPGRDVGKAAAAEAVDAVIQQYGNYGVDIEPSGPALAFIREHAFLKAVMDTQPENYAVFTPSLVYPGDAERLTDLAENLGTGVFPVAYDTYDGASVLMDRTGRFFFSHHTGHYHLGREKYEAMISLTSGDMDDAEDHSV